MRIFNQYHSVFNVISETFLILSFGALPRVKPSQNLAAPLTTYYVHKENVYRTEIGCRSKTRANVKMDLLRTVIYEELTKTQNLDAVSSSRRFCSVGGLIFVRDQTDLWRWYQFDGNSSTEVLESREAFSNIDHCKENAMLADRYKNYEGYAKVILLETLPVPLEIALFYRQYFDADTFQLTNLTMMHR